MSVLGQQGRRPHRASRGPVTRSTGHGALPSSHLFIVRCITSGWLGLDGSDCSHPTSCHPCVLLAGWPGCAGLTSRHAQSPHHLNMAEGGAETCRNRCALQANAKAREKVSLSPVFGSTGEIETAVENSLHMQHYQGGCAWLMVVCYEMREPMQTHANIGSRMCSATHI